MSFIVSQFKDAVPAHSKSYQCGAFLILFPKTGHVLVGHAGNLFKVIADIKCALANNRHRNIGLQLQYNQDDQIEVLCRYTDFPRKALEWKTEAMDAYKDTGLLLNISPVGRGKQYVVESATSPTWSPSMNCEGA